MRLVCMCLVGDYVNLKQKNNVVITAAVTSLDVQALKGVSKTARELRETHGASCGEVKHHLIIKYCCEHGTVQHSTLTAWRVQVLAKAGQPQLVRKWTASRMY